MITWQLHANCRTLLYWILSFSIFYKWYFNLFEPVVNYADCWWKYTVCQPLHFFQMLCGDLERAANFHIICMYVCLCVYVCVCVCVYKIECAMFKNEIENCVNYMEGGWVCRRRFYFFIKWITADMPLSCWMFLYKGVTSAVTNSVLVGSGGKILMWLR